jgi:phage shock protein PspC (stress-responsive transcriptional regulator)
MNKTVSINIGGIVFHIDEHAYEKLKSYLQAIRSHFDSEAGREEIISDIESRIAEIFAERIEADKREVVMEQDVEAMIEAMGRPEDFGEVEEGASEEQAREPRSTQTRRFYRNPDDKVLGGVLSGISAYFNIDPIWLRLAFVLGFFIWGTGLLIYIILWIIIPEAKSATEKLEMKGEKVNLGNIEKTVKEEINSIKETINDMGSGKKVGSLFERFVNFVITVVQYLFKFAIKLFGLALAVGGVAFLVMLSLGLSSAIGVTSVFPIPVDQFFSSNAQMVIGLISAVLLVGIPLVALLYLGVQILFNFRGNMRGVGLSLGLLWVIGIIGSGVVGAQVGTSYRDQGNVWTTMDLTDMTSDTLYLESLIDYNQYEDGDVVFDWGDRYIMTRSDKGVGMTTVYLNIIESDEPYFQIKQGASARGSSRKEATELASEINYQIQQTDSLVRFSPLLYYPDGSTYHSQKIQILVKVPVGKTVYLGSSMDGIIYDIDNVTNTLDSKMLGHKWLMTNKGLACVDCDVDENGFTKPQIHNFQDVESIEGEDFDRIVVEGSFDLNIEQGDRIRVKHAGSRSYFERVKMTVKGETLRIKMDKDFWSWGNRDRRSGTVDITLPELQSLELSGSSKANVKGFEEEEFEVEIAGACDARIDGDYDVLDIELAGNNSVILVGSADVLNAEIAGSSKMRASRLETNVANIDIAGWCKAEVNVRDVLNVDAAGACEIRYKGDPDIQSDVAGASSIKKW